MGLHQIEADSLHFLTQPLRLQYLNLAVCVSCMLQQLLLEIEVSDAGRIRIWKNRP